MNNIILCIILFFIFVSCNNNKKILDSLEYNKATKFNDIFNNRNSVVYILYPYFDINYNSYNFSNKTKLFLKQNQYDKIYESSWAFLIVSNKTNKIFIFNRGDIDIGQKNYLKNTNINFTPKSYSNTINAYLLKVKFNNRDYLYLGIKNGL